VTTGSVALRATAKGGVTAKGSGVVGAAAKVSSENRLVAGVPAKESAGKGCENGSEPEAKGSELEVAAKGSSVKGLDVTAKGFGVNPPPPSSDAFVSELDASLFPTGEKDAKL